jgi:hypothetical protein
VPLAEVAAVGAALAEGWRGFDITEAGGKPWVRLGLPGA